MDIFKFEQQLSLSSASSYDMREVLCAARMIRDVESMIYVEATFGSSVDTVRLCQVAVSDEGVYL